MLESLLGNRNKERVLIFLYTRNGANANEISNFYNTDLSPIQNQLEKLEIGNILVSRMIGKTRLYEFNPRYPFLIELKAILEKAVSFIPDKDREKYYTPRLRPRRKGKPIK